MSIQALPQSTVRQIGSTQVLTDPSSVVKELIDNALDGHATNISVEISTNTIDIIQVRDNGHGIMREDRAMICRRYCTSKIREFDDLKDLGGKSLGFRGEAMASLAETSGGVSIITRVEGEDVAEMLKMGRNGEIEAQEKASHPIGTTVRAIDFFSAFPVRKQAALKHSSKVLAKIKHLMKAYALARPAVRLSLRVLKAKNDRGDWVYAPKTGADFEDAALKVVGKDCASQCGWSNVESNGFQMQAFLPKMDAKITHVSGLGQFISIDSRPVSSSRGTLKQISSIFKGKMRKANPQLQDVKDPFLCLSIACPPGSYDPNIEPSKDDVLFDDSQAVLGLFEELLDSFYTPPSAQPDINHPVNEDETLQEARMSSDTVQEDEDQIDGSQPLPPSSPPKRRRTWKANMYEHDEDEDAGGSMADTLHNVLDEEESAETEQRDVTLSNPWIIAKMNSSVKPSHQSSGVLESSTSLREQSAIAINVTPDSRPRSTEERVDASFLTTPTELPMTRESNRYDGELARSIQRLSYPNSIPPETQQLRYDYGLATPQASSSRPMDEYAPDASPESGTQLSEIPEIQNRARRPNWRQQRDLGVNQSQSSDRESNWFPHLTQPKRSFPQKRSRKGPNLDRGSYQPRHIRNFDSSDGPEMSSTTFVPERNRDIRSFVAVNHPSSLNSPEEETTEASSSETPSIRHGFISARGLLISGDTSNAAGHLGSPAEAQNPLEAAEPSHVAHSTRCQSQAFLRGTTTADNAHDEAIIRVEPTNIARRPSCHRATAGGFGDRLQRTRSSLLPLETTPQDSYMQNVVLVSSTSVSSILEGLQTFSSADASNEWNTCPDASHDAFSDDLDTGTLKAWSDKLSALLHIRYPGEEMIDDLDLKISAALRNHEGHAIL